MNDKQFIYNFEEEWQIVLIAFIIIFSFLFFIQYFFLKKGLIMCTLHSFFISALITVI